MRSLKYFFAEETQNENDLLLLQLQVQQVPKKLPLMVSTFFHLCLSHTNKNWRFIMPIEFANVLKFRIFNSQDYLKTVVPSQLFAERGSNLVVINPGSFHLPNLLKHTKVQFPFSFFC